MIDLGKVKRLFPALADELVVVEKCVGRLVLIDKRGWGIPLTSDQAKEIMDVAKPMFGIHRGIHGQVNAELLEDSDIKAWWGKRDVIHEDHGFDDMLDPNGGGDIKKSSSENILSCVRSLVGMCEVFEEVNEATDRKVVGYGLLKMGEIVYRLESHMLIDFDMGVF